MEEGESEPRVGLGNLMKAKRNTKRKPKAGATARSKKRNKQVVLLSGGNPQIAKADGDAPVQAYIAVMLAIDSARAAGKHAGRANRGRTRGDTAGHHALRTARARRLAIAVALDAAVRRIGARDGAGRADLDLARRARIACRC